MFSSIPKILRYFIFLLLVVFVLATLQLKGHAELLYKVAVIVPEPIAAPVRSLSLSLRKGIGSIFSIRSLYVENGVLKTRVSTLEQQVAMLEGAETENQTLKATLGFVSRPPVALVPCTVLARDPEGITQTLLLSCGAEQGVTVGQGVVSSGYLIGKVLITTKTTATVRLITAPTTVVDVRIGTRQLSGVLKGSFGSGLLLDFIPEQSEVAKGDIVTTAGINDRIPPNILVGSISEVVKQSGALFLKLTVSSPVDLRDIRYVHVLKP